MLLSIQLRRESPQGMSASEPPLRQGPRLQVAFLAWPHRHCWSLQALGISTEGPGCPGGVWAESGLEHDRKQMQVICPCSLPACMLVSLDMNYLSWFL